MQIVGSIPLELPPASRNSSLVITSESLNMLRVEERYSTSAAIKPDVLDSDPVTLVIAVIMIAGA